MSGTVVSRAAYEGRYLGEGDVLFEIVGYSCMWFVFDVYERDLVWLRIGMMVDVSVESHPVRSFTAPIDSIDPTINPMSRTAKVRVVLENPVVDPGPPPRHALRHKLYAEAAITLAAPEVLAAPRRAILDTGIRKVAYVALGESAFEQREVKTGRRGDSLIEILSGLRAGERVVTEGNLILDGQAQLNASVAAHTHTAPIDEHSSGDAVVLDIGGMISSLVHILVVTPVIFAILRERRLRTTAV